MLRGMQQMEISQRIGLHMEAVFLNGGKLYAHHLWHFGRLSLRNVCLELNITVHLHSKEAIITEHRGHR